MSPKTFIFIGRSGCGKGTQAKILRERLSRDNSEGAKILYLETGPKFREFIKGESYSSKLSARVASTTARQPDFLAVWIWTETLLSEMTENTHLLIDGAPRALMEAQVLDTALGFYQRERPCVIYVDVSREWSKARLLERHSIEGRDDDQLALIDQRLNWFDEEIRTAVGYYDKHPGYQFVHVNGEQPIEAVSEAILSQLNW